MSTSPRSLQPTARRSPHRRGAGGPVLASLALFAATATTAACDDGVSSNPEIPVEIALRSDQPIDFSTAVVGASAGARVERVIVENRGHLKTPRIAVDVIGPGAASYRVVSSTCRDAELAPDATCDVQVLFAPGGVGAQEAMLRIRATTEATLTVPLRGEGRASWLSLATPAVDVGVIEVGTEMAITIDVQSLAAAPLDVSLVARSSGGQTRVERAPCLSAVTERCTSVLVVSPTVVGAFSVQLEARSGSEHAVLEVKGTGAGRIHLAVDGSRGGVRSSPDGLTCRAPCSALFTEPVTLAAEPDLGFRPSRWEGCTPLSPGLCRVAPAIAPQTVRLSFEPTPRRSLRFFSTGSAPGRLVASVRGQDLFACELGQTQCGRDVEVGTEVTIRVNTPSAFGGWTAGPCPADARACTFSMPDEDVYATATLERGPRELSTTLLGTTRSPQFLRFLPDGRLVVAYGGYHDWLEIRGRRGELVRVVLPQRGIVFGVAVDPSGGFYVLASQSTNGFGLHHYDSAGVARWVRTVADDALLSIRGDALLAVDGGVVVAVGVPGSDQTALRSYDAAGEVRWSLVIEGRYKLAAPSAGGGVTLVAESGVQLALRAVSAAGVASPPVALPPLFEGEPLQAFGADPDGNVVLVTQRAMQVYSPAGERVRAIDAASAVGSAWLASAASTLVRLSVFGAQDRATEYRVAAHAPDGSLRWEVVDEPSSDDDGEGPAGDEIRPLAVAVAADGTVAVAGRWFGLNILGEAFVRFYAP